MLFEVIFYTSILLIFISSSCFQYIFKISLIVFRIVEDKNKVWLQTNVLIGTQRPIKHGQNPQQVIILILLFYNDEK